MRYDVTCGLTWSPLTAPLLPHLRRTEAADPKVCQGPFSAVAQSEGLCPLSSDAGSNMSDQVGSVAGGTGPWVSTTRRLMHPGQASTFGGSPWAARRFAAMAWNFVCESLAPRSSGWITPADITSFAASSTLMAISTMSVRGR